MTVSLLAWRQLSPSIRNRIIELLKHHPAYSGWKVGSLSQAEADAYCFCRAATWPDAIRDASDPFHDENRPLDHYVDFPHSVGDFPIPPGHSTDDVLRSENILKRMKSCVDSLRDESQGAEKRAKQLSWLLHLFGDLHQPLHCATQYSKRFPDGDKGGNLVLVGRALSRIPATGKPAAPPRLPRLHAYWDEVLGPDDNLREADEGKLKANYERIREATDLCGTHTREDFREELRDREFAAWAHQGFELAVSEAYDGDRLEFVAESEWKADPSVLVPALPLEYQKKARDLGQKRIALAGYRLADQLEAIFKP